MNSQRNANPTEILLPSGKSIVQRSLLFRNNSGKDFVLKLVASSAAIIFPTTVFRFPPASYRTIQFRVDTKLLNHWDSLTIKGFVLPVYSKSLKQWIERKSTVECPTQEAFHLNLKFGNQFSAPQTVVNLPGNSECIDSTDHPVDVEELDTLTAINIEKDVKTADPIASMMGVVNEHKQRTKSGQGCWLTNLMCGEREEQVEKSQKSAKSAKSCKSESRGHLINDCLDATPCGGSTIKT